jgi:hypothetical protein
MLVADDYDSTCRVCSMGHGRVGEVTTTTACTEEIAAGNQSQMAEDTFVSLHVTSICAMCN